MASLLLTPHISEKAMNRTEKERTYVFVVPKNASKVAVSKAVTTRFKVSVQSVNTTNISGKPKATLVKRGRRSIEGSRSDFKKAYVKLAKGQSITLFEQPKKSAKPTKSVKPKKEKGQSDGR